MMKAYPRPRERSTSTCAAIMSAGEAVGTTVFEWARDALGVTINEMFGQTEMNYIVGNSHTLWPAKPGSMGRPYPGHRIAVIDDDGSERARRRAGRRRGSPHRARRHAGSRCSSSNTSAIPKARAASTPATGAAPATSRRVDDDGYLWYQGRADDMFKVGGLSHRPVGDRELPRQASGGRQRRGRALARRDARQRRQGVHRARRRACAVARRSRTTSSSTCASYLAPYEYPKEIEFIDALPMTTTGKVQRQGAARARAARKRGRLAIAAVATRQAADRSRLLSDPGVDAQPLEKRAVREHPTTAGTTVGRISEPNWIGERDHLALQREKPVCDATMRPRGDRDVLQEVGEHAPRDERQQHDVADARRRGQPGSLRGEHERRVTSAARTNTAAC